MILNEIKINLKTLSRPEKFHLIQFLLSELAQEEEQELFRYFSPGSRHGCWSQYNAFDAAQKLHTLLEAGE